MTNACNLDRPAFGSLLPVCCYHHRCLSVLELRQLRRSHKSGDCPVGDLLAVLWVTWAVSASLLARPRAGQVGSDQVHRGLVCRTGSYTALVPALILINIRSAVSSLSRPSWRSSLLRRRRLPRRDQAEVEHPRRVAQPNRPLRQRPTRAPRRLDGRAARPALPTGPGSEDWAGSTGLHGPVFLSDRKPLPEGAGECRRICSRWTTPRSSPTSST
jgi:hypothetical protein